MDEKPNMQGVDMAELWDPDDHPESQDGFPGASHHFYLLDGKPVWVEKSGAIPLKFVKGAWKLDSCLTELMYNGEKVSEEEFRKLVGGKLPPSSTPPHTA